MEEWLRWAKCSNWYNTLVNEWLESTGNVLDDCVRGETTERQLAKGYMCPDGRGDASLVLPRGADRTAGFTGRGARWQVAAKEWEPQGDVNARVTGHGGAWRMARLGWVLFSGVD